MTKSTKLFVSLITMFISSFFFCSSVFADTTITYTSAYNDYYVANIDVLKNYGDNKLASLGSSYTAYFIDYNPTSTYPLNFYFIYNNQYISWKYQSNHFYSIQYPNSNTYKCRLDAASFEELRCINSNNQFNFSYPPMYSTINFDFFDLSSDSPFVFQYDTYFSSFSPTSSESVILPTYDSLYTSWHATSPDNTPILTNYYSLIFEKLGVLTNFFKDNSYLYSIPLIPIFIFCFYLIKRSLIK